jgi:hypothetical protein
MFKHMKRTVIVGLLGDIYGEPSSVPRGISEFSPALREAEDKTKSLAYLTSAER